MNARQTSILDRLADSFNGLFLQSIVRVLSVSFAFLAYLLYSLLPSSKLEDKRAQAIGSGAITLALIIVGFAFLDVGGLGGTAASLIVVQVLLFFVLAAYGNLRK